jgi:drug/metabolite transporter (DMT)-like permease
MPQRSAQNDEREDRPILGIAANTAAFAVVSISDAMAKLSVALVTVPQALGIRSGLMLILLSPLAIAAWMNGRNVIATQKAGLHLLRFAFYAISTACFFLAVGHLEFTFIASILLLTPVFSTLAGVLLFKERIERHHIGAASLGLVGSLFIIGPNGSAHIFWISIALISSVAWGLAQALLRPLSEADSTLTILIWSNGLLLAPAALLAIFDWTPLQSNSALLLLAMAATQLASQWLSATAYSFARVATVAPMQYTQMLWAPLLGSLFWHERPTIHVGIGASLIVMGGIWLIRSEAR